MSVYFYGWNNPPPYYGLASAFDYNAAYTVCFWFNMETTGVWTDYPFLVGPAPGTRWDFISRDQGVTDLRLDVNNNGSRSHADSTIATSSGTWNFVAARRNSVTSADIIQDAVTRATNTTDVTGRTAADHIYIGAFGDGWSGIMGQITQVRVWTAALTDAELLAEKASPDAVRSTNLWASWRMASAGDTTDYSGNGRNLTVVGTPTPTTGADNPPQGIAGVVGAFGTEQSAYDRYLLEDGSGIYLLEQQFDLNVARIPSLGPILAQ